MLEISSLRVGCHSFPLIKKQAQEALRDVSFIIFRGGVEFFKSMLSLYNQDILIIYSYNILLKRIPPLNHFKFSCETSIPP